MNYQQSLDYLNSFFNLERIDWSKSGALWNLDRMRFLLKQFGHPEKSFFSVIIAGTKGKGSTGFFLESILKESKIRTGFYTSPHLESPRERIRMGGHWIPKKDWAAVFSEIEILSRRQISSRDEIWDKSRSCPNRHSERSEESKRSFDIPSTSSGLLRMTPRKKTQLLRGVTYFEIMTLAAALAFKKKRIQVAIWEVGMGGRLDATNAMEAKLGIITPIHLDHTAVLGKTIAKITAEKAAVIAKNMPVVVSKQTPEANRVIKRVIQKQRAKLFSPLLVRGNAVGLLGDFQKQNAGAAVRAADILKNQFGFEIPKQATRKGLQNKNWPGRFEVLGKSSKIILDGAHNPAAMKALMKSLRKTSSFKVGAVIFGTAQDKDAAGMLKVLASSFETVFLVQAQNPRAVETKDLLEIAKKLFNNIIPVSGGVDEAIRWAKKSVSSKEKILITGSFYVVGEARKKRM